ncbi:MAG TPA: hypothetical protein VE548_11810 [Nitrososphaeraceae archaeon]|jgi:hypothetical protein|nr:hypothetical protein [Nitrososphaeraceae archaeon]
MVSIYFLVQQPLPQPRLYFPSHVRVVQLPIATLVKYLDSIELSIAVENLCLVLRSVIGGVDVEIDFN